MKHIVSKEWLANKLGSDAIRVVDCRFSLSNPSLGQEQFNHDHLPGALYFDLEKDLSGIVENHGGRHPLPALDIFIDKLEESGIGNDHIVVVYDNGEAAFAARFWWMLSYLGHKQVYILDGGYQGWKSANLPITSVIQHFQKESFTVALQSSLLADVETVRKVVSHQVNSVLIDSREPNRFKGIEEPIDKKKGHLPGAVNKPWYEGLQNGYFKGIKEQAQRFNDLEADQEIIVYCGSGVTATPNVLALKEAGFKNVKLYVGSFSDWISYEDNEIN